MTSSHAYLDGLLWRVRQLADGLAELADEVRTMTATVSSPNRLVTATVGPEGKLVDLTIDPRVYREPDSAVLAATIRQVIERAQAEAARQETEIRARALPGATDLGSSVGLDVAELKEIFKAAAGKGLPSGAA